MVRIKSRTMSGERKRMHTTQKSVHTKSRAMERIGSMEIHSPWADLIPPKAGHGRKSFHGRRKLTHGGLMVRMKSRTMSGE